MRTMLLFIMIFMALNLCAQVKQEIKVSSGEVLNSVVDKRLQYAFDDFTDGVVLHSNGGISRAKLNYSYLLNEMQYVDPAKKDTLTLAQTSSITVISIGGRKFIPRGKEFIELLTDGNISLGVKRMNKVLSEGAKGAYGTSTVTSSASSVSNLITSVGDSDFNMNTERTQKLSVTEVMQVYMNSYYYLVNVESSKTTAITNVKSFLKVYPKDKAVAIEQYVSENKIDFKKEEDLLKLTSYCDQL